MRVEREPSPWLFCNKSPANDLFLDSTRSFFFSFIKMLTFRKTKPRVVFIFWRKVKQMKGGLSVKNIFRNTTENSASYERNLQWWRRINDVLFTGSQLIAICVTTLHYVPKKRLKFEIHRRGKQLKKNGGRQKILIAINVINDFEHSMSIVH